MWLFRQKFQYSTAAWSKDKLGILKVVVLHLAFIVKMRA
jgi:hypothetical protein